MLGSRRLAPDAGHLELPPSKLDIADLGDFFFLSAKAVALGVEVAENGCVALELSA